MPDYRSPVGMGKMSSADDTRTDALQLCCNVSGRNLKIGQAQERPACVNGDTAPHARSDAEGRCPEADRPPFGESGAGHPLPDTALGNPAGTGWDMRPFPHAGDAITMPAVQVAALPTNHPGEEGISLRTLSDSGPRVRGFSRLRTLAKTLWEEGKKLSSRNDTKA